jgi:hypothetical protein
MLFTNTRAHVSSTNSNINQNAQQPNRIMPFSMLVKKSMPPNIPIHPIQNPPIQPRVIALPETKTTDSSSSSVAAATSAKKMKWGEPIWFLFHTLAEKVNDNYFSHIRKELLDLIYTICDIICRTCTIDHCRIIFIDNDFLSLS